MDHENIEKIEKGVKAAFDNYELFFLKERISEVARMMGGPVITEKTLQRAEEMLQNAEKGIN